MAKKTAKKTAKIAAEYTVLDAFTAVKTALSALRADVWVICLLVYFFGGGGCKFLDWRTAVYPAVINRIVPDKTDRNGILDRLKLRDFQKIKDVSPAAFHAAVNGTIADYIIAYPQITTVDYSTPQKLAAFMEDLGQ